VQLVTAHQAKQLTGRPKTDKLDVMWLARLTEKGLLRPSFVPPAPVRALRHYTRARTHLTQDRTRCFQRLEKLLEDALIKLSAVASKLATASARDMAEALIAGERDPVVLAGLARSQMKAKHAALVAALTGMFDDHHGELARMLLDQIAFLDARIRRLTLLISEQLAAIPAAWGIDAGGATGPGAATSDGAAMLPAAARLDEIPGISADLAAAIIAATGLDMTRFPHPRPPGVVGRAVRPHPAIRPPHPPSQRPRQQLPARLPRPSRHRRRRDSHLPRRTVFPHRPPPRQSQSPSRRRPHPAGHHLAPARRPPHPLPRPRPRLLPAQNRQRQTRPQPHPPAPSTRL
jgi:transposase